jgi:ectoine hydroxylase-related dioxygenase (phytanoyl-CoA dioxygenase family)
MLLFKEKINYKLAGSGMFVAHLHANILKAKPGGFAPHTDAVAYVQIKDIKHLTILLAVDASNMTNGGLEVVPGSHKMKIPINEKDHCIEKEWVSKQEWVPVELEPGEYENWLMT